MGRPSLIARRFSHCRQVPAFQPTLTQQVCKLNWRMNTICQENEPDTKSQSHELIPSASQPTHLHRNESFFPNASLFIWYICIIYIIVIYIPANISPAFTCSTPNYIAVLLDIVLGFSRIFLQYSNKLQVKPNFILFFPLGSIV